MKDKVVYTEIVASADGEVITSKKVIRNEKEPDFVKLYVDCVLLFKGANKGLNPILIEFLKYMSYASPDAFEGGQIIYVNKALKENIAKAVGVSLKRIEQALTDFVKTGIFKRVAVGTYQVNPNIFGRGDWVNIKNIRAEFDFGNNVIVANIEKGDDTDE